MAPPRSSNVGGQNPEFVLREFEGMNLINGREAIGDNEFYWLENLIPVGPAALYPVNGPSTSRVTVAGESGPPSYSKAFNINGNDYIFVVWKNTGNGWIYNVSFGTPATKIFTGTLTSGQTSAIQYNAAGLLIVDPNGFWDYNLTSGSAVTSQVNTVSGVTIGATLSAVGGSTIATTITVSGSGVTFTPVFQVTQLTVTTPGTGYVVGDVLQLTDGSPTTPASVVVTSVSSGTITGISLTTGGAYPAPARSTSGTSSFVATGPAGSTFTTTSSGTGAVFKVQMQLSTVTRTGTGTGYSSSDTGSVAVTGPKTVGSWTVQSSGVIGGTAIATYAGRVWIASGRVVNFTDINSYFSFGGAGGSFTIQDDYLHNGVTALYSANSYLYIFGDSSIDALSNVTVNSGVTSFSRINLCIGLGTSLPTSVFGYYRSVVFYHDTGVYLLSGATPERISEKISSLIQNINTNGNAYPVFGCTVVVQSELCIAMMVPFLDTFSFSGANTNRVCALIFFRGKWWVASFSIASNYAATVSIPFQGVAQMYYWDANNLYFAFSLLSPIKPWIARTKLWDGGAATREKQSINAAVGALWVGSAASGVTVTIDTEIGSSAALTAPLVNSPSGYQFSVTYANEGGGQYLGLTVAGSTDLVRMDMLALRGKTERDMMQ